MFIREIIYSKDKGRLSKVCTPTHTLNWVEGKINDICIIIALTLTLIYLA